MQLTPGMARSAVLVGRRTRVAGSPESIDREGPWDAHTLSLSNNLALGVVTCPDPGSAQSALGCRPCTIFRPASAEKRVVLEHIGSGLLPCRRLGGRYLDALKQSIGLRAGGDSNDWFFLAMACWKRGQQGQAQTWLDQAEQWMEKNRPHDRELSCAFAPRPSP